jgi:hypothetical protein
MEGGMPEQLEQLDELLVSLGGRDAKFAVRTGDQPNRP